MDEAIVLIDIGYLSKVLRRLGYNTNDDNRINYFYLANNLARPLNLRRTVIYYYCAPPPYSKLSPTKSQREAKSNFDKFIARMKTYNDFIIRVGRTLRITFEIDGRYYEKYVQKGVDTWLTMDLLEEPQKQNVKNVILVASDSDFVPVINRVKGRDIRVILYHYTSFGKIDGSVEDKQDIIVSHHLLNACGEGNTFELTKEILDASVFKPKLT